MSYEKLSSLNIYQLHFSYKNAIGFFPVNRSDIKFLIIIV